MGFKAGKLPPKYHPKTLCFSKYLTKDAAPLRPAQKVYREYKIINQAPQAIQMYGNDQYGDCPFAGAANLKILWTLHTGKLYVPTLQEVLDFYTAVTGFNPSDPSTDNGAALTDVLAYWQANEVFGGKILAWAGIDITNRNHREIAVDLFGATYTGVTLPDNAQDQFGAGQPFELVAGYPPDPQEGHCIIHPGQGALGGDYVTWAKWDQKASAAWESACIDEEYGIITEDWLDQVTQLSPSGLDLATLQDDLAALKG